MNRIILLGTLAFWLVRRSPAHVTTDGVYGNPVKGTDGKWTIPVEVTLAGDGNDALPATVEVLDKNERHVPTANLPVEFETSGPGAIIGLGNGDPTRHEPEKGNPRSLFNGLARVIIQSQRDGSGNLVLRVKAAGLKPAETTISIKVTSLDTH
jgi:beta-galactosidase